MSPKEYYTVATFQSSSRGNLYYRVNIDTAGNLSCTCPGWCRRVAPDGSRTCKHIRKVQQRESGPIAPAISRSKGRSDRRETALGQRRLRL